MSEQKTYSILDMISWLRVKFSEDGYIVYDQYTEEPGLPIHLYCTKSEGKTKECLVIIVTSTSKIDRSYFDKLCFLQSYFLLYIDPTELKLILAMPEKSKIIRQEFLSKLGHKQFVNQESYAKRGFGLLKIKAPTKKEPIKFDYVLKPNTLRNRMMEEFGKEVNVNKRDNNATVVRFFNRYIEDAVFGIAGVNPVKFEERNIDKKLLELVANLENISYTEELKHMANDYLNYYTDDYSFAKKWIGDLWGKYYTISYPDIHERLEPMLKELYPEYRDHFLHQFQVFLLGSIIIDYLIKFPEFQEKKETLSKSWLLASTFHDFAKAIELYDNWSRHFFKESLKIDTFESLELKKFYVENTFSSYAEHIISSLGKCFCEFDEQDKTENYNKIRAFFYYQITDKKNHGLLSSLSLLKRFEHNGEFHKVILPSATAIAIHDDEIWQSLSGISKNSNEPIYTQNLCTLKPIQRLELNLQPLAFLLILCDNIQDWGRHFGDEKLEESLSKANVSLKSINFSKKQITIQLSVNENTESLEFLNYKLKILKLLESLLHSSYPNFVIEFWDREAEKKLNYDVAIGND